MRLSFTTKRKYSFYCLRWQLTLTFTRFRFMLSSVSPLDSRPYFLEITNAHLHKGNQCWISNFWLLKWVGSPANIATPWFSTSQWRSQKARYHCLEILKHDIFQLNLTNTLSSCLFSPLPDAKKEVYSRAIKCSHTKGKEKVLMFSFVTLLDSQASLFTHSFQTTINYSKVYSPKEHWNTNSELLLFSLLDAGKLTKRMYEQSAMNCLEQKYALATNNEQRSHHVSYLPTSPWSVWVFCQI